ncbi:ornithine carbamoyltransferase [Exiguobacterium sp. s129]|uniref:ornithine carbamoyltransferase n=1 Tax=Exiguobacterium sp. s129 TaxID=2751264 RepID=UPI001BE775BF|nr:ornithine carbamoyltransferase [Exiguobacterium sp. s129]
MSTTFNFDLKGRHFLSLNEFSGEEINYLIDLSAAFKRQKKQDIPHRICEGKNIALLFEKPSTRTRCAFTVAAIDLGMHPEYLGKNDIQFGKKESVRDTAIVLGRMFDGIQFRGFAHETVEGLAKDAGVPVWNGLTDLYHPTQILADFLTVKEQKGKLAGIKFVYVGDGRNNMGNTLLIGGAKVGMDMRICAPKSLWPSDEIVNYAKSVAAETGAVITLTESIEEAMDQADVVYTDVWVSMGEEAAFAERIELLRPYQVNMDMLQKSGNPDIMFLHCLPAFHDLETEVGRAIHEQYGLTEMEVTDEVFRSRHSFVFDEAENRMHTIKAVMAATLTETREWLER